jgi:predicted outer membrane protein
MNLYTEVVATIATAILAIGTLNAPAQAQAVAPTDPQIVGIVVAANQIDID